MHNIPIKIWISHSHTTYRPMVYERNLFLMSRLLVERALHRFITWKIHFRINKTQRHSLTAPCQKALSPNWFRDLLRYFWTLIRSYFGVQSLLLCVTDDPHWTKDDTGQEHLQTPSMCRVCGNKLRLRVDYLCLLKSTLPMWKVRAKLKCPHQANTMSLSIQGSCLWVYFCQGQCVCVCFRHIKVIISGEYLVTQVYV